MDFKMDDGRKMDGRTVAPEWPLVRLYDVDWAANDMRHVEVTCDSHRRARYLTKGPGRHLHFVESHWTDADGLPDVEAITAAKESGEAINWTGECSCHFSHLRVIAAPYVPLRSED